MIKRILGIDTGTNSLGWAVVERNESGEYRLIRKGSLIFEEGVKIEKGIESSRAAERTGHRALRRQYFRRRLRKIETLKVLVKYGWCPYLSPEELKDWHTKKSYPLNESFLNWQRTDEETNKNPYYFRHICLNKELDLNSEKDKFALGRAMYHLAQRRGFKSNRLEQTNEDETGKVKSAISNLAKEMSDAGCEYLGDYFYKLYDEEENRVRIRTRYTDRDSQYKKEFYAICAKQNLSQKQIKELEQAIYFQRPLKSQRQGVGYCTMEKRKRRCADSHPAFETFRMLSFINNIKVKGPNDSALRPLNDEEVEKIKPKFFRKSEANFDFEDIAKAIAGRNNYQYYKAEGDKPYKFNYRMSQGIAGCPTIANLKNIFGDDYANAIAEVYDIESDKTPEQKVEDVWNVLYSFQDKEKVKQWGLDKLQLDDKQAENFSKIKLSHNFASLSLCAIKKILPWLEEGYIYSHAVLMAKVPDIVGKELWERKKENIITELNETINNFNPKDEKMQGTLDFCIKSYLKDNFDLAPGEAEKLYHPSMIETYPDAQIHPQLGVYQLGRVETNAVRNPMAMRSLHKLRKVINQLLKEHVIDQNTEVHIEYARELSDSNKRKAIAVWNNKRRKEREKYKEDIKKLYKAETGKDIEPTEADILKFELWEEQNHICLYTGEQIGIADFIGENPLFDIEHTIPRSVGGDSRKENMTLCSSRFNREIKRTKLPSQLSNHEEILARLENWKKEIEKLHSEVDRYKTKSSMDKSVKDRIIQKRHLANIELSYLKEKYKRFTMEEVPEGFAMRQGAGIGLVSKYAGLYLKSLFHKKDDRTKSNVRVIKGFTTAEFRKMWGIQDEYEKKNRDNHIHHCIDAITIACIDPGKNNETARYYQQLEEYEQNRNRKPVFPKPWPTFTEDIKALSDEILVVHDRNDNMPKQASKMVITPKGKFRATGDAARCSLHKDTYYGAIERNGEVIYVVRRPLSSFDKESDINNIVDDAVREKVKEAVTRLGFKQAMASDIYMNKEKGILIKKVRCYANSVKNPINIRKHRDKSSKEYKQHLNVTNDSNYMLAIYEDVVKGKVKRDYELVRNLEAAQFFKQSTDTADYPFIVPKKSQAGYPLKYKLTLGLHVLLYEKNACEIDYDNIEDLSKRLYVITGLSYLPVGKGYGTIVMRHHQEARMAKDIKSKKGAYKNGEEYRASIFMYHTQFNALVEGADFEIDVLGHIKPLRNA